MIINAFNSDNIIITNIKTQLHQTMKGITNGILKFRPVFKIPVATNYTFFTIITFHKINSFT